MTLGRQASYKQPIPVPKLVIFTSLSTARFSTADPDLVNIHLLSPEKIYPQQEC